MPPSNLPFMVLSSSASSFSSKSIAVAVTRKDLFLLRNPAKGLVILTMSVRQSELDSLHYLIWTAKPFNLKAFIQTDGL